MLSIQAREYYKFVIEKLGEFQDNINDLTEFSQKMRKSQELVITTILNNQTSSHTHSNARTNVVSEFINNFDIGINTFKQEFRAIDFILEYQKLENEIKDYIKTENINSKEIEELFNYFETFKEKVQHFHQYDSDANARLALYDIVTKICSEYNKIIDSYTWFIESLEDTPYGYDEEKYMLFDIKLLGIEFGVFEFADKIKSIAELYEHLALIVPKDDTDTIPPLKIVKIESGSLCFIAIGSTIIAGLMVQLISYLASNMSAHFKSKKELLPKKEIEKIIDKKLGELGVDKKEKEHIAIIKKKCFEITNKFFSIKINNERYSYEGNDITALSFFETQLLNEGKEESEKETVK